MSGISAPLMANSENRKLRRQFLPRRSRRRAEWRWNPRPDNGNVQLGPGFRIAGTPIGGGWTFVF